MLQLLDLENTGKLNNLWTDALENGMRKRHKTNLKGFIIRRARRKFRARLRRANREYHGFLHAVEERDVREPELEFLRSAIVGKDRSFFFRRNRQWIIQIPERFSFITNPDESLDVIASVIAVSKKKPHRLYFDYAACYDLDLGASAVLDVVTLLVRREWRLRRVRFKISGNFPTDPRTNLIALATGLTKNLGVRRKKTKYDKVISVIPSFQLKKGKRKKGPQFVGAQDQEIVSTELIEHLNWCFRIASGYTFTKGAETHMVNWAGELMNNAEEHSGRDEWYTTAYMMPLDCTPQERATPGVVDEEDIIGECRLTVFNFGRSIYDSLKAPETPEVTKAKLRNRASPHVRSVTGGSGFSEGDLWTMYALQEGVSRYDGVPGQIDRGNGTVTMINAFQQLGRTIDESRVPRMVLISGETRILFDDKYQMSETQLDKDRRMIIAFNQNNKLEQSPDPAHVHSLRGRFPGTILTMQFFIDKRYIEREKAKRKK